MNAWNEGYVIDIPYDTLFFRDLCPDYLRMALLLHGVDLPKRKKNEPLRYLELGYGQGLSLNVFSAAVPGEFWGTDFNADHTLRASELAQSAQLPTNLLNLSFAELDARGAAGGLPSFDIIVLHGVWSWVLDEHRRQVLNIINRNLKTGGIVYVSYNTLPGWAPFMPVRDLMAMYSDAAGPSAGNSAERMTRVYTEALQLAEAGAGYFVAHPQVKDRLKGLQGKSLGYLVHEYLNSQWRPFYFADVATALGLAKCSFVTSSRLISQLDICLPEDTLPLLRQAPNVEIRETLRDYSLNQQFRADIFVKGSRALTPRERMDKLGALRVSLTCPQEAVSLEVSSPRGPITLKEDIYKPVLAALADGDYAPKSLEELEDHPLLLKMESAVLMEAITVLTAAGYVHPARKPETAQAEACARLNRQLCERVRRGESLNVLASPVLGGGLGSSRLEMLLLSSRMRGLEEPAHWAEDCWNVLAGRGEQVLREGKALSADEARTELEGLARRLAEVGIPLLTALQALPENLPENLPEEQED